MPNQITANGIEVATQSELLSGFTTALQTIYGADINIDPSTPDGQLINIIIQSILDLEDLVVQVHNNFDPDTAFGTILDQRVAINGIQRKAGTYSTTEITLVNSQSVLLQGLDTYPDSPYTISDNAGNQWYLTETEAALSAGTHTLVFRAAEPGATLTTINTITLPITIVLGVDSVNNPSPQLTVGLNEETDAQLKIRRQQSVSLVAQGYLSAILAAINNVNGVTTAIVLENDTNETDAYGIPAHSIWAIVGGDVEDADIATAIYQKRNAGCGIYATDTGTTHSYVVTQPDGSPFEVRWDAVAQEDAHLKFSLGSIDGVNPPDEAAIVAGLPALITPAVGAKININEISTAVQTIDANCIVTYAAGSGLSLSGAGPFTSVLSPSSPAKQLVLTSGNIVVV